MVKRQKGFDMYQYYYQSVWWRLARLLFNVFACLAIIFLVLPILVMIPLSFSDSSFLTYPITTASFRWYRAFFESEQWLFAMQNSVMIACASTLCATFLGALASLGIVRGNVRVRTIGMSITMLPMIVPVVIVAVGLYFFFAYLGLVNTYLGLIIAHTILGIPFVVITVVATLRGYDENYSKAAASLGASPWLVFRTITLPLIAPGIISGALFVFVISFDEIIVTLFLAGPRQYTLPIQMFSGIRDNIEPTAVAAATMMVVFSSILLLVMEWLRRRNTVIRSSPLLVKDERII